MDYQRLLVFTTNYQRLLEITGVYYGLLDITSDYCAVADQCVTIMEWNRYLPLTLLPHHHGRTEHDKVSEECVGKVQPSTGRDTIAVGCVHMCNGYMY